MCGALNHMTIMDGEPAGAGPESWRSRCFVRLACQPMVSRSRSEAGTNSYPMTDVVSTNTAMNARARTGKRRNRTRSRTRSPSTRCIDHRYIHVSDLGKMAASSRYIYRDDHVPDSFVLSVLPGFPYQPHINWIYPRPCISIFPTYPRHPNTLFILIPMYPNILFIRFYMGLIWITTEYRENR